MRQPTKKTTLYLSSPIMETLKESSSESAGGPGFSHRLAEITERYFTLLLRDKVELEPNEYLLLCDVFNGAMFDSRSIHPQYFAVGVSDAGLDAHCDKWSVDKELFISKISSLSNAQCLFLIEAIQYFWRNKSAQDDLYNKGIEAIKWPSNYGDLKQ